MNPIFALGGTMFVMITVMIIYGRCGGNIQKRRYIGLSTQAKATIISVSYISIGRIIIFILLDIGAMIVREIHVDPQVQSIYHEGNFGDLNDIIYNIPVTLLVFDGIALFAGLLMVITALCFTSTCTCMCSRCCTCSVRFKRRYKDCCYYPLVLTVVPLIFSAYSHAPYIIMAYVSDTSYASSIFIYYVIAIFVEFGVLEYTFSTLFKKWKKWKIFLLALVLSVFINGTMASIITFFFFIPIKYALSRAPSEVLLIYQSVIILVGGYITYKAVFKDKRSQQEKLNSDVTLLEDEIATLKDAAAGCHLAADPEACIAAMDEGPDITNRRKRIAYLRNEMALASLKQKIDQCQSEGVSQTEVVHLRSKICHLGGEITDYLEDKLKHLESNCCDQYYDKDEVVFLRDKIYHINLEIIEQLRQKFFNAWCSDKPCDDSWIVGLRKEMSVKVKRVFAFFPDHLDGIESLRKSICEMDERIRTMIMRKSSLELDDIQNGEHIILKKEEIMQQEKNLHASYDDKANEKHWADIDSLWSEVICTIDKRIKYREDLEQPESMSVTVPMSETYSLKEERIELLMKRISYQEARLAKVEHKQESKGCKLKIELDSLRKTVICTILERVKHQEQILMIEIPPVSDQKKLVLATLNSLKLEVVRLIDEWNEQESTAYHKDQLRSAVISLINKEKRSLIATILKDHIDTLRSAVVSVFKERYASMAIHKGVFKSIVIRVIEQRIKCLETAVLKEQQEEGRLDQTASLDLKNEIDSSRCQVVTIIEKRIKYREERLEDPQTQSLNLKNEIDSLRCQVVTIIEKRIKYREERLEDPQTESLSLKDEIKSFSCQVVTMIEKRIKYREETLKSPELEPTVSVKLKKEIESFSCQGVTVIENIIDEINPSSASVTTLSITSLRTEVICDRI